MSAAGTMLGEVRRPFLFLACLAMLLVVLVELGSGPTLGGGAAGSIGAAAAGVPGVEPDMLSDVTTEVPRGNGIRYLVLVDGFLLFSVVMLGASVLVSQRAYGRVQGIITLVFSFLWLIMTFVMALAAFVLLMVMIGLFLAAPFGTIAYLAVWGYFPRVQSAVVLGLLLFLKLVFLGCLVLAQQRFLKVVPLMTHVAVSFVLQVLLGVVHGFLPLVVVSIGDQLWALVVAVVALIGTVVTLVSSVPAVVNAARVSASRRQ